MRKTATAAPFAHANVAIARFTEPPRIRIARDIESKRESELNATSAYGAHNIIHRHVHESAYEIFFILSGEGVAHCQGESFAVRAGDLVAFKPGTVHALDNVDARDHTGSSRRARKSAGQPLFALQLMLPNEEAFARAIARGNVVALSDSELCTLIAERCGL